ncbi:uncharacterized protein YkwD [Pseudonocardia autotrophica]|uniref:Cysteine-rich secretory protein family protein n=2 Tax=Pseudonocardiaceae TaxID=2070 RepID=A0A1Y2N253_PSEAH|nr:Cysteine-rich secretory protein family protein [Pseudonocardia autotrophica]TDN76653.1 uncharacterized protein YkwD [Pseudonocardia autotrophica]
MLGGVGAGAVLAMAAPLTPLGGTLPGPAGAIEETVPLRPAGAATATLPTAGPGPTDTAPPPALLAARAAREAFAGSPADPGAPARAAVAAAQAHRAALDAAPRPGADAGGDAGRDAARDAGRPAPSTAGLSGQLALVVELTNVERAAAGCSALRVDPRINAAAQGHSEDMAANGYFSHDSRDGRDFADRMTAAGHPSPGAENIAAGQPDAATVVADWMASPGHRKNILDCSLSTIGVGLAGGYWTQNFGR